MGGTVFVGIRRRDGSEHLYERWTNSIPWYFADAEFVNDGPGVDEFVRRADELEASGETLYTKKHHHVTYSEYGVILIDHKTKKMLSCQGYAKPGQFSAFWHSGRSCVIPPEDADIITKLNRAGRLKKFIEIQSHEDLPEDKTKKILKMLAESTDGNLPKDISIGVVVCTNLDDFELVHISQCDSEERKLVRQFLVDNGWKARVYGQRKE
jgi:hypothetical protein